MKLHRCILWGGWGVLPEFFFLADEPDPPGVWPGMGKLRWGPRHGPCFGCDEQCGTDSAPPAVRVCPPKLCCCPCTTVGKPCRAHCSRCVLLSPHDPNDLFLCYGPPHPWWGGGGGGGTVQVPLGTPNRPLCGAPPVSRLHGLRATSRSMGRVGRVALMKHCHCPPSTRTVPVVAHLPSGGTPSLVCGGHTVISSDFFLPCAPWAQGLAGFELRGGGGGGAGLNGAPKNWGLGWEKGSIDRTIIQ